MRRSVIGDCCYLCKVGTLFLLICAGKSCDSLKDLDPTKAEDPLVLLISLDGFRYDYLDYANTPVFDSLVSTGVKANSFIPVFPTKTFPNHYTQVTGLYPENHGIVSNRMFDGDFNEYFEIGSNSTSDGKWYGGEPIWVTANKHHLVTATMFWPGSDAEICSDRPTYYHRFNSQIPESDRIAQIVDWLGSSKNRPHLLTLYIELVDAVGHVHGPDSQEMVNAIVTIDRYLGLLMDSIYKLGLTHKLNLVIVSDHGMTEISRDRVIFLDDYIDTKTVEIISWSPILEIIPASNQENEIFRQLAGTHENLNVYTKTDPNKRWHFSQHKRIAPIIAVADVGWSITSSDYFYQHPRAFTGGTHGYDPKEPSMHGIFIASGPSFKQNIRSGSIESIHLYELLCHLLSIAPASNDGTLDIWQHLLYP